MTPIVDRDGWVIAMDNSKSIPPLSPAVEQPPSDDSDTMTTLTSPVSSFSESSGSSATDSSSNSSFEPLGTRMTRTRIRPAPLQTIQTQQLVGVDPKVLVGKVLTHVHRSAGHPAVTMSFGDGTAYQVRVDGYDPRVRPRLGGAIAGAGEGSVLEMDDALQRLFDPPGGHAVVELVVQGCARIRLADKAYERARTGTDADAGTNTKAGASAGGWDADAGHRWDQSHDALAFRFVGGRRWHCVWAMRAEHDDLGRCTFRTFDDVYLQPLARQSGPGQGQPPRSPMKMKPKMRKEKLERESWRKET